MSYADYVEKSRCRHESLAAIEIEPTEQITWKKRNVYRLVTVRQTPPALIEWQKLFYPSVAEASGHPFLKVRLDSDCKPRRSAEFLRFTWYPTWHGRIRGRQPNLSWPFSRVSMNPRALPPLRLQIGSAIRGHPDRPGIPSGLKTLSGVARRRFLLRHRAGRHLRSEPQNRCAPDRPDLSRRVLRAL